LGHDDVHHGDWSWSHYGDHGAHDDHDFGFGHHSEHFYQ
jgi:hypothetical protein